MRMRSHRRNVVGWELAVGPVDRYVAPRFPRTVRMLRIRRRPLLLTIGALLIVISMALPSSIAFIAGFLVIALGAPDALPCTPTTALVRLWEAPRTSQSDHPGTRTGRRQWFGGHRKRSR
jgi:hypothetical protein